MPANQYELMRLIIGYTIVGAFVFTVIITCGSLIGLFKFADSKQQQKLFITLIVEIAGICLGIFTSALNLNPNRAIEEIRAPLKVEVIAQEKQNAALQNSLESITLAGLRPETAKLALALVNAASVRGIRLRIISSYRGPADQSELYEQGRSRPGNVVTRTKVSVHTLGLAFDVAPEVDGKLMWDVPQAEWETIGRLGEDIGLIWGGNWKYKDYPHFETKDAKKILSQVLSANN